MRAFSAILNVVIGCLSITNSIIISNLPLAWVDCVFGVAFLVYGFVQAWAYARD